MKLFLFLLSFFVYGVAKGQSYLPKIDSCDFESPCTLISIPDSSIWIVGKPQKTHLSAAKSGDFCLITDTVELYPQNHHSYFDLIVDGSYFINLSFDSKCDFDSFYAGGYIELSIDSGQNWLNFMEFRDSFGPFYGGWVRENFNAPLFNGEFGVSGKDSVWSNISITISFFSPSSARTAPYPNRDFEPIVNPDLYIREDGDKFIFRFHMVSDTGAVTKNGWMIDNIKYEIYPDWVSITDPKYSGVTLFPNPTNQYLYLSQTNERFSTNEPVMVCIYDISGRKLLEESTTIVEAKLDVSQLAKGVYLLEIKDKEGKSGNKKFVKY